MDLMKGKKGVIFGVSNNHGIAYAIAQQLHDAGADIAFTYAGDAMEKRVRPLAEGMNAKIIMPCDVTNEDEVKAVFAECEKVYGKIDFVVHAVAFAAKEDLQGEFSLHNQGYRQSQRRTRLWHKCRTEGSGGAVFQGRGFRRLARRKSSRQTHIHH